MNNRAKNIILVLIIAFLIIGFGAAAYFYWYLPLTRPLPEVVMPDEITVPAEDETSEYIRLYEPVPSQVISSPLLIRGQARGTWFFEASFPVALLDKDGRELAVGIATTSDEWMTEDFVYFESRLEFIAPAGEPGVLVLKKDNPSGLPEFDDELRIPVFFMGTAGAAVINDFDDCVAAGYPVMESYPRQCRTAEGASFVEELNQECVITGCSKQVCADQDVVTTCEYRDEYSCLEHAVCERQDNGDCGWTHTDGYRACMARLGL